MCSKRILAATIAGGIASFLLGWLVYGMLLMDFMQANSGLSDEVQKAVNRPEPILWMLLVSNLIWAYFYALVLDRGNFNSAVGCAKAAAIMGLIVALSYDVGFYALTHMLNKWGVLADVGAATLLSLGAGAVIGLVYSKMAKS